MTVKKMLALVGVLVIIAVLGTFAVSTVFAQAGTPTPGQAPNSATPQPGHGPRGFFGFKGFGFGFGRFGGGSTAAYDAAAKALNLTPTQLFDQLHSGKTLAQIAQAQGVDLTTVQNAMKAVQVQAMKDRINQAVTDGKITQAQADWLLKGLDNGYLGGGRGAFGNGMGRNGHMRGMRGFGGKTPAPTPTAPAAGTSS